MGSYLFTSPLLFSMPQLTEDAPAPTTVTLSPLPVLLASETILSIFILLGPYLCLSFTDPKWPLVITV